MVGRVCSGMFLSELIGAVDFVELLGVCPINLHKTDHRDSLGARHLRPSLKCPGAEFEVVFRFEVMTADAKEIIVLAVYTRKPLRVTIRSKPAHRSLLLSSWFVRNFCSVVCVPILAVRHGWNQFAFCGGVTPKLVGSDFDRYSFLSAQGLAKESLCSLSIFICLYADFARILKH